MKDCIFCKIVAGEIPCYKVFENEKFLAFLDIRPLTRGNTLVIPKKHYRWVYDVPDFGDYFAVAGKIARKAIKVLGAEWVSFLTLGFEVPHAHIRVIPRYKKDLHGTVVDPKKFEELSKTEMLGIASKLREGGNI